MTEWKTYRLGDICTLNYGKSLTATNRVAGDIPVYSSAGITGSHNVALVQSKGIIVGRKGTVGTVYYSDKPFYCIDTAYYILPDDEKYDFKWLYYRLKSLHLDKLNEDSAVPGLNRETAYAQEISLPSLEEQRRIAGILGAIDDKIENNRRINTNLELQAQALYKQWFVDFEFPNEEGKPYKTSGGKMVDSELGQIPEGWRVQTFGDLIKPQKGKNITRAQVTIGSVPVVAGGLMPSCYHNTSNTHCPVVTISASGANAGYVKMYHMPIWAADCSYIDDTISKYVHFAYVFLTYNQTSIYHKQQGCAQPHIYPSHLMELQFICPTLDILDKFESWSKKIYKLIGTNIQENETLATLRDTLLPKLMNGEIKL